MGDAGFNKGGLFGRNLKAGSVTLSGGADTSVSFDRVMKAEPEIVATAQSAGANVNVVSKNQSGFTLGTDASSDVDVSFIAFNDNRA
jgi:hypothetical protein